MYGTRFFFLPLRTVLDLPPARLQDASLSGKWALLRELLSPILAGGEQVVVFTQYVAMLQMLKGFIAREHLVPTYPV